MGNKYHLYYIVLLYCKGYNMMQNSNELKAVIRILHGKRSKKVPSLKLLASLHGSFTDLPAPGRVVSRSLVCGSCPEI